MSDKNSNYRKAKWYQDMKKSESICIYCDEKLTEKTFTVDHVIPQSKGGEDSPENCKPCCEFCNTLKSNMSLEEFNERYPKEKIKKLKKYTDSSRSLNESELYDSVINRIQQAIDLLESIDRDYSENKNVLSIYDKILREIMDEAALEDDMNASGGFAIYKKIRNINRNKLRIQGELRVLSSFSHSYQKFSSRLDGLIQSINQKSKQVINQKYKPLIEEDIRNMIESEICK